MKISLISNLYEPYARGGAEVVVKRMAKELIHQGHQVVLITARPWDGVSSMTPVREEKEGLAIYHYYPPNLFFYANDYKYPLFFRLFWHIIDIFNAASANSVTCILQKEKPDLVITHNLMGMGYLIPRAIRHLGIKHIHVLHDIQLAARSGIMLKGQENRWIVAGAPARLYQRVTKRLFGSPYAVVSPSKFLLDFYISRGFFPQSRKEVIPNPVDDRFFTVKHQQDDAVRFLYIGQFADHKGLKDLCEAFIATEAPNARLTLIGDGPQLDDVFPYENKDKRVQTMPRIVNESLPDVLAQTDVVVLPTKTYENSPTVIYEALGAAVPVMVSDIGGSAELVEHQKDGYVVTPGSVQAIKTSLSYYLGLSPSQRQEMGERGRNKIAPLHSEAYVKRILSL